MSRPAVTLKLATSLDGRIATASGESKWITGEEARAEAHRLRAAHDAVLIGVGTALADDPELTARTDPPPARQPVRVVLDSELRLPPTARLARSAGQGKVVVFAAEGADEAAARVLREAGLEVVLVPRGLSPPAVLQHLAGACAVRSVLVEGGGRVAAAFVSAGLVDRIEWFRAPILVGEEGRAAIGPLALAQLCDARRFRRLAVRPLGADLWESYERA
jgi:diaminohydroxyphosphoribosylaminopyrimidine deaminase/5-amino-6-(5-phosphoribosylamino)uracil reductase